MTNKLLALTACSFIFISFNTNCANKMLKCDENGVCLPHVEKMIDHAHIKARARGSRVKTFDNLGKFDYKEKYYEIPKGWEIDQSIGNHSTPRFIAPNGFSPICGPTCADKIATNGFGHTNPKCGWVKVVRDQKNPRKYLISAYAGCVESFFWGLWYGGGNWAESNMEVHLIKTSN
ncbi:hypothetical protein QUF74_03595 [Candidatus Halobeggiatoa sp. HSG11]|nr:hypothetical protein [Candidatus Halobeggiatoa sp. HSG11]